MESMAEGRAKHKARLETELKAAQREVQETLETFDCALDDLRRDYEEVQWEVRKIELEIALLKRGLCHTRGQGVHSGASILQAIASFKVIHNDCC